MTSAAAGRLRDGDLGARVEGRAVAEIGELALDFNAMGESLQASHEELEAQNRELEAQQIELEAQQAELETATVELEEQRSELERTLDELELEQERVQSLYEFGRSLAAETELERVARTALSTAAESAGAEIGALYHDRWEIELGKEANQQMEEEIIRLLGPFKQLAMAVVGLTSNGHSTLAQKADIALVLGPLQEVCPLGLAPSTSTTAMIAVGDALAFVLSQMRQFTREDFARYHPAGSLGRKLLKVDAIMRRGSELRLAHARENVRDVFARDRGRGMVMEFVSQFLETDSLASQGGERMAAWHHDVERFRTE